MEKGSKWQRVVESVPLGRRRSLNLGFVIAKGEGKGSMRGCCILYGSVDGMENGNMESKWKWQLEKASALMEITQIRECEQVLEAFVRNVRLVRAFYGWHVK